MSYKQRSKKYQPSTAISKLNNLFFGISTFMTDKEIKICVDSLHDVNYSLSNNGETILFNACKYINNKSLYAIKLLLEKGANPNIKNINGNTPLIIALYQWAIHKQNMIFEIVNELVKPEHNVDIGTTNNYNKNALYYACLHAMPDVALILINTGKSNPCINDYDGDTSLYQACLNKMEDVAIRLIELCPTLTNTIYRNMSIYDIALKNNLTRVLIMIDPLLHVLRGIETHTKQPFYDIESIFELQDHLNRGGKTRKKRSTKIN